MEEHIDKEMLAQIAATDDELRKKVSYLRELNTYLGSVEVNGNTHTVTDIDSILATPKEGVSLKTAKLACFELCHDAGFVKVDLIYDDYVYRIVPVERKKIKINS